MKDSFAVAVAAAAIVVNVRHVFYALSFRLHRVHGVAGKVYSTFALTDEAFALTARPEARTGAGRASCGCRRSSRSSGWAA